MSDHETIPTSDLEKAKAEIQKLYLEIRTLEWENSLLGRVFRLAGLLTIIATVITIIATGFGVWQGYMKFNDDRQKERDLKTRELKERNTNHYRSDLQLLAAYPLDPKQTIAAASFLFYDLQDLVENEFYEDRDQRRFQVGSLISQMIRSDNYDLTVMRNVEFDRKALYYCDYYKKFLEDHPQYNSEILNKYKFVLDTMRKKDPKYYRSITVESNFSFKIPPGGGDKGRSFVHWVQAYQEHMALFDEALKKNPSDPSEITECKQAAACWFQASIKNDQITGTIFNLDHAGLKTLAERCGDMR